MPNAQCSICQQARMPTVTIPEKMYLNDAVVQACRRLVNVLSVVGVVQLTARIRKCLRDQLRDETGINANHGFTLTQCSCPFPCVSEHAPVQLDCKTVVEWIRPFALPRKPRSCLGNISLFPLVELFPRSH